MIGKNVGTALFEMPDGHGKRTIQNGSLLLEQGR